MCLKPQVPLILCHTGTGVCNFTNLTSPSSLETLAPGLHSALHDETQVVRPAGAGP